LPCFFDAIIGTQIDFLVLDGSPEALDKNVVSPCALAVGESNFVALAVSMG
jgi:hypothetical protein